MNLYEYVAISNDGEKILGSVFAENYNAAYRAVYEKKKKPLKISKVIPSKRVNPEDLLMFFLHIDLQLKCKIRINEAIESFLTLHSDKLLKSSLAAILLDLKSGTSLGKAFEKCDKIFDPVIIGLLKSAEQTGKLSDIISSILNFLKLQSKWKNNIKRAIAYPTFIVCIAIFVLLFSITLLGPSIKDLIRNFGTGEVPLLTQVLIEYVPDILKTFLYLFPFVCIILAGINFSPKIKFRLMNYILKIPKIGSLIVKLNFWQICKVIQIALEAKLDFISSLDIAIKAVEIENIKKELYAVENKIIDGYSISEAFSEAKFIPRTTVSAIDIGEESGNLVTSFKHIGDTQYEEISLDIKSIGQKLSIGLTFFAGMIFVTIICGLLFPIYNCIEIVGVW